MLPKLCALLAFVTITVGLHRVSFAAPLVIDGSVPAQATCPGGTPVDSSCAINATTSLNRGCRYGGEHTFDSIEVKNGGWICAVPFDGTDKATTGNVVLKSETTIVVDATSRITAKGGGYRGVRCGEGEGPTAAAGGRGGCSVLDSGGGGAHFGNGGRGTKDCTIVAPATSCQFPQEWEEDCGDLNAAGNACVSASDPLYPVCYGTTNGADGAGNAAPTARATRRRASPASLFDTTSTRKSSAPPAATKVAATATASAGSAQVEAAVGSYCSRRMRRSTAQS